MNEGTVWSVGEYGMKKKRLGNQLFLVFYYVPCK